MWIDGVLIAQLVFINLVFKRLFFNGLDIKIFSTVYMFSYKKFLDAFP
jgi:hypothetical protein